MASSQTTLGQKYQKKSDKEHVLDNPDTYVGSIENVKSEQYVFDPELNKIVSINMDYNLRSSSCLTRVLLIVVIMLCE